MQCSLPSCSFLYFPDDGTFQPSNGYSDGISSVLIKEITVIQVKSIRDSFGLHYKLLSAVPWVTYANKSRKGARDSIIVSVCCVVVLIIASGIVIYRSVQVLRDAEKYVLNVLRHHRGRRLSSTGPRSPASVLTDTHSVEEANEDEKIISALLSATSVAEVEKASSKDERPWTRFFFKGDDDASVGSISDLSEIAAIQTALRRVDAELRVLCSFLPQVSLMPPVHSDLASHSGSISSDLGSPKGVPTAKSLRHLQRSLVTYVAFNSRGFHKAMERFVPTTLQQAHADYVEIIVTESTRHGGVVDSFHGDQVLVHFNAATRVVRHAHAALRMVIAAKRSLRIKQQPMCLQETTVGISTGEAVCGLLGVEQSKRFTVIGSCVSHATVLCWKCRADGFRTLIDAPTIRLVYSQPTTQEFVVMHTRLTILPHDQVATVISTLLCPSREIVSFKGVLTEEAVEPRARELLREESQRHKTSGCMPDSLKRLSANQQVLLMAIVNSYNTAFDVYFAGDLAKAKSLFDAVSAPYENWLSGQVEGFV